MNFVAEGEVTVTTQDNGRAAILEIDDPSAPVFVRLHHWAEDRGLHPFPTSGRVRVTVEFISKLP